MLFNSVEFLFFFPVVLSIYFVLSFRYQNYFLLAASYLFYSFWDWRFLSLILISTITDFVIGKSIAKTDSQHRRKVLLAASLFINLGILGFFKYYDFFITSFAEALGALGFDVHLSTLRILLPVGISFYTFQTLSYTFDIYRRQLAPTHDFLNFALFVAYFPQLVAGPIERARNLLPRLTHPRQVSWPIIGIGIELLLIGYLKKVGVADTLGPIVDLRFQNPRLSGGADLLLSAYLFSIQIYCDFSGYSDIARGVSKLFGIDLMRNFNQPYFSTSVTEFWRRWHISLSTWLRDYLYISLGGNRLGVVKTYRNLAITMLLGGLWHGANWTFVVWGGIHGAYLAIHKYFLERRSPQSPPTPFVGWLVRILKIIIVFHLVTLAWIFFRCNTFSDAFSYLSGIASWQQSYGIREINPLSPRLLILVTCILVIDIFQYRRNDHAFMVSWPWLTRGLSYAFILLVTLILGNLNDNVPFIYFQF